MKQIAASIILIVLGFFLGYVVNSQITSSTTHSNTPFENNHISSYLKPDFGVEEKTVAFHYNSILTQTSVFGQILFTYQLANAAGTDRLETDLIKSVQSRDPFYNYNITSIFFEAYAALDPLSAMKFVNSNLPPKFLSPISSQVG
ncbi:MAG: hypothetical protein ACI9CE_002285 [Flavobacterium sp.]|jgi:hypothetical protein